MSVKTDPVVHVKKTLPQLPKSTKASSLMGRKIDVSGEELNKTIINDYVTKNRKLEKPIEDKTGAKAEKQEKNNLNGQQNDRFGYIVPPDWKGDVSKLTKDNLPEGTKVVKLVDMNEEDKQELSNLITDYVRDEIKLHKLQDQQAVIKAEKAAIDARKKALEEKQAALGEKQTALQAKKVAIAADRIEIKKNAVKTVLAEKVLNTTMETLCNFVSQDDLEKITCDLDDKKCLIMGEEGVDSVIIPFLKAHSSIKVVNLGFFKDEIHGNALIKLFKALPETEVNKVIIAKVRKAIMTTDELTTIALTKSALASRGFTIALS
jgi:hypothetical protein